MATLYNPTQQPYQPPRQAAYPPQVAYGYQPPQEQSVSAPYTLHLRSRAILRKAIRLRHTTFLLPTRRLNRDRLQRTAISLISPPTATNRSSPTLPSWWQHSR